MRGLHAALSILLGLVWGMLAYALGRAAIGPDVWGGVIASPLIGLVVGSLFRRIQLLTTAWRIFFSLVSLYLGAMLFGLAIGIYDVANGVAAQRPIELILQSIVAMLWGTTVTGYVMFLWPLAYLSHRLLARVANE